MDKFASKKRSFKRVVRRSISDLRRYDRKRSKKSLSNGKVLLCFPDEEISFRVSKSLFFPLIKKHGNQVTSIIPQMFIPLLGESYLDNVFPLKDSDITTSYLPSEEYIKQILTGKYTLAADLNIDFNLITAFLVRISGSSQRIGFHSEYSNRFFNIEIRKRDEDLREEAYLYIKNLLTRALN